MFFLEVINVPVEKIFMHRLLHSASSYQGKGKGNRWKDYNCSDIGDYYGITSKSGKLYTNNFIDK